MKRLKCIILSLTVILINLASCLPTHAAENGYSHLLMPTQIKKIGNTYFIVDCNHDQVIYSDQLSTDLANWKVLTRDTKNPHAIAGDGEICMVVDTDNNRVLTFAKVLVPSSLYKPSSISVPDPILLIMIVQTNYFMSGAP